MTHHSRSLCIVASIVGTYVGASRAAAASAASVLSITEPTGGRVGDGLVISDVSGIPSVDLIGSPLNTVLFIWVGPFNYVTGAGWDVVLQTLVPDSRRRDMTIIVRDTNNADFSGFAIQPGAADPTPGGPTPYSSNGIVKLENQGIPPLRALADGTIRLEFFESREHAPGITDGLWVSGVVSLQTAFAIPTPVSPGVVGLFVATGAAHIARRRRPL